MRTFKILAILAIALLQTPTAKAGWFVDFVDWISRNHTSHPSKPKYRQELAFANPPLTEVASLFFKNSFPHASKLILILPYGTTLLPSFG
jgi:hypothetical protein